MPSIVGSELILIIHTQISLGIDLVKDGIINALHNTFENGRGTDLEGLIHHSDRDQYAFKEYVGCLQENGIQISMSRKGNPYENA